MCSQSEPRWDTTSSSCKRRQTKPRRRYPRPQHPALRTRAQRLQQNPGLNHETLPVNTDVLPQQVRRPNRLRDRRGTAESVVQLEGLHLVLGTVVCALARWPPRRSLTSTPKRHPLDLCPRQRLVVRHTKNHSSHTVSCRTSWQSCSRLKSMADSDSSNSSPSRPNWPPAVPSVPMQRFADRGQQCFAECFGLGGVRVDVSGSVGGSDTEAAQNLRLSD